jgi:hypothetical protein
LFEQSTKLKRLNHGDGKEVSGHVRQKVDSKPLKKNENNESSTVDGLKNGLGDDLAESDSESPSPDNGSWVEEYIFTPYLVQDVAHLLVEHYYPSKEPGTANDRGTIQISFKIINARYGIDFLSLHSPNQGVKQARSQVLQYTLNPARLERIYTTYVHDVLDAFQDQALRTKKKVYASNGKKEKEVSLTAKQIAEMFGLYSTYFQDVGRLLAILSNNQALAEDIQRYLQAEQDAIHAGYLLKQRRYYAEQEDTGGEQQDKTGAREEESSKEQVQAVEEYRQALQHREQTKGRILDQIQAQAPKLSLSTHEIMYVAQWVHRRLLEGEKSEALGVASDLLQDFARRLSKRSQVVWSS